MSALYSFTSHIAGKNATVEIHQDHIEWSRKGVSGGKLAAGIMTMGISTLATGVRNKDTDMIPMRQITGVTTQKNMTHTVLKVMAGMNVVELRASHKDAEKAKQAIQAQLLAL